MELFQIKDLSFTYPQKDQKALDNVTLSVSGGDFTVVCGQTGCGKTTLLRMLKRELRPYGSMSGRILYRGAHLDALDDRAAACEIGYVLQNPDNQIVTDKVWHELSFGLESMGLPTPEIRRRVGEMASFFGIEEWFRSDTGRLSGGQKQLLNLASVMVMQPKMLILDEPTSQLDPIAAADFIATLQRLNRELGLTILLAEHRLEDVFPAADKVLILENGGVLLYEEPHAVAAALRGLAAGHPMQSALPSAARIFIGLGGQGPCPITVKEGRRFLSEHFTKAQAEAKPRESRGEQACVEMRDVWFRYERDLPDILRGVSFKVFTGEVYCILGGNGAGKTTALNILSGLCRPYRGGVAINGKRLKDYKNGGLYRHNIALLPQDPQTVFLQSTVEEDFGEACGAMGYSNEQGKALTGEVCARLSVGHLLQKHPYDLSGGEQQKCALAKLLLLKPKILLLDEPTKGIDAFGKRALAGVLKELKETGITVIIVTHDVEFAAANADRCALFFDGQIVSEDIPGVFFARNSFYTTAANRMARHLFPNAVTCEHVIALCKKTGGIS